MKKKLLALLIAGAMITAGAYALAGCSATPDADGGDKTEQSETPVKPEGNGEDKTEQTEKPEGNGDKTDDKTDDKTEGDKKPDQTGDDGKTDDKTEQDDNKTGDEEEKKDEQEDFQTVIDALQAKLDDEYGEGAEILTIYTYANGKNTYLACKIKYENAIKEIGTTANAKYFVDGNGKIFDVDEALYEFRYAELRERSPFIGLYFTDGNDIIAEKMIEARVGKNYDIICAAVSDITEVTDGKQFKVYALIADNDGKVYEFTETLVVTGTGNAYDTVINEERGNFESPEQTQTELGALADNYYAVMR